MNATAQQLANVVVMPAPGVYNYGIVKGNVKQLIVQDNNSMIDLWDELVMWRTEDGWRRQDTEGYLTSLTDRFVYDHYFRHMEPENECHANQHHRTHTEYILPTANDPGEWGEYCDYCGHAVEIVEPGTADKNDYTLPI